MADARKDKRTLLSLKIRYKSATLEDFIERYSVDISRGGVFIKAKKPPSVGTLLKFEFLLRDESSLIHGVGRVVWRREEAESDDERPAGMGIKFIKMDPECRATVQRIVEDREGPGTFDLGAAGGPSLAPPTSQPAGRTDPDRTSVRHVSEFLASALSEGGAGEAANREAQRDVERAREASKNLRREGSAAARALGTADAPTVRQPVVSAGATSKSASTAFGSSSNADLGAQATMPLGEELFGNESTQVHQYAHSEVLLAKPTVAPPSSVPDRKPTPLVPASEDMASQAEAVFPPPKAPAVPNGVDSLPEELGGPAPEARETNPLASLEDASPPTELATPKADAQEPTVRWTPILVFAGLAVVIAFAGWRHLQSESVAEERVEVQGDNPRASALPAQGPYPLKNPPPNKVAPSESTAPAGVAEATKPSEPVAVVAPAFVLKVSTRPAKARVTLPSGERITTPGTVELEKMPRALAVTIAKPGHRTLRRTVRRRDFTERDGQMRFELTATLPRRKRAAPKPAPRVASTKVDTEQSIDALVEAAEAAEAAGAQVTPKPEGDAERPTLPVFEAPTPEAESGAEARAESGTEPETETEPESATGTEPETEPETEPASGTEPETEPASGTESERGAGPGSE